MCESPTPYIIGMMRTCKHELLEKFKDTHDMIIIDLDKKKCILDNDDDIHILPESVIKTLKLDVYNLVHSSKLDSKYEKNVELCRVFLKIFLKAIGNYRDFLLPIDVNSSNSYNNQEKYIFMVRNNFFNKRRF